MNFVVDIGLDSEEEINMNLLCYADSDFDKLINKFPTDYFSNIDLIKIKAIVYSLFVRYDILMEKPVKLTTLFQFKLTTSFGAN